MIKYRLQITIVRSHISVLIGAPIIFILGLPISKNSDIIFTDTPRVIEIIGLFALPYACSAAFVTVIRQEKNIAGDRVDNSGAAMLTAVVWLEKIRPSISRPNTLIPSDAGKAISEQSLNAEDSSSCSLSFRPCCAASASIGAMDSAIGEMNAGMRLKIGMERFP